MGLPSPLTFPALQNQTLEQAVASDVSPRNWADNVRVGQRGPRELGRGTMADATAEITYIENPFGVVTDRRVVYYRRKGWFSGGSWEDEPLKHGTSVRYEISLSLLGGILLILLRF